MERILVVDDEEAIVEVLQINLQRVGYEVVTARTGQQAIQKARSHTLDLILLDIQLPDMDGHRVADEIRKEVDVPIIFVTARGDDIDRIVGLERGADDYIVKPFNPREVVARVAAVLRRLGSRGSEGRLIVGSLILDFLNRKAIFRNELLELSPKEFDLLRYFASNLGKVVSREEILRLVWGTEHLDTRTVDVHVKNLRDKLKDDTVLKTVWGRGYLFALT